MKPHLKKKCTVQCIGFAPILKRIYLTGGYLKLRCNGKVDLCACVNDLLFITKGNSKAKLEDIISVPLSKTIEKCFSHFSTLFTKSL